jgi:hypothetical protein
LAFAVQADDGSEGEITFGGLGRCPLRAAIAAIAALPDLRLGIKPGKILSHCALLTLCIGPVQLVRRFAMITAGVGLHDACIDRETFTLNKTRCHARRNHALKDMAQDLALGSGPTDSQRTWNGAEPYVEIELAKPAVSKMQCHFLAQPTLMAKAVAVADKEHPDHQLGIDPGTTHCGY